MSNPPIYPIDIPHENKKKQVRCQADHETPEGLPERYRQYPYRPRLCRQIIGLHELHFLASPAARLMRHDLLVEKLKSL